MSELQPKHRPTHWHPLVGDVARWYPVFVEYAAAVHVTDSPFHGPHAAPMIGLDRVVEGLDWLVRNHGEALDKHPLPSVEQLRGALGKRNGSEPGSQHRTNHDGSPMHNFWHWCHGG